MTTQPENTLEEATRELERCIAAERRPTRYEARDLLIPLGELLSKGESPQAEVFLERIAKAVATVPEIWSRAVFAELELACAEHVHAVDPRYLDHARYDFRYTVEARARFRGRALRVCYGLWRRSGIDRHDSVETNS